MNKEERVLKLINRKPIDYLPSQMVLSDRCRMEDLKQNLGFNLISELENYLENHLYYSTLMEDVSMYYRNNNDLLREAEEKGFCKVDWDNKVVYNNWGEGIEMDSDGFYVKFHPLQTKDKKETEKFMPDNIIEAFRAKDIKQAIKKLKQPDSLKKDNFKYFKEDLKKYSNDLLVIPAGYWGIFERAYSIIGFEEYMMLMASGETILEELLELITDYKIKLAKKIIELGFKVAHYGDDLGDQNSTLFSKRMFQDILKPRIAKLWRVYKDAGLPIIMHSCGNITDLIPDLIDIGLDVLNPVQPVMDLNYLKKEFGNDITFYGGIDTQELLPYGTPDDVKRGAKEVIKVLGNGGGYIISPSQDVMRDVPIENIKALVETIKSEREKVI